MSSKLTGDWGRVDKMLKMLPKDLVEAIKQDNQTIGNQIREDIQDSISSQTGAWQDLDESTIKAKNSNAKLLDTGSLKDSINTVQDGNDVIIAPMGSHPSGLSASDLATIHEYGTTDIPSRPFIRPVYNKHKEDVDSTYTSTVKKIINKY